MGPNWSKEGGGGGGGQPIRGRDLIMLPRGNETPQINYMKRGQETAEKQTLRLYEKIGLRANSLKI